MAATHARLPWNPEDPAFWAGEGHRIAMRHLVISAASLMLSFAVWMLWSVLVVHLPDAGYRLTTNQLFWLAALPALSGASLRVLYAFAVPLVGGRRWTAWSTASLLVPALGIGLALSQPQAPYELLVLLALLCGLGGANFASSMAHVSGLYPRRRSGWVMGLNAGLGHLGVSAAQALVPLAVAFGTTAPALGLAGYLWVLPILAVALAAWFGMQDLAEPRSSFSEQAVVFQRRDNWLLCWLYLGSFGSFIGFAAALPLLLAHQFPGHDAAALVWLMPLLGAALRPLGGWLSDQLGGARTTLAAFVAMLPGLGAAALALPGAGGGGNAPLLFAGFAVLFGAAGVGSSSVFRLVPSVFDSLHRAAPGADAAARETARRQAQLETAATLGLASAIGAYGGFVIPKALGSAIQLTGSPLPALALFTVFYLSCIAITARHYGRTRA